MDILYHSTRGYARQYSASEAILQGLAPDGGLFVPQRIPVLEKSMRELAAMDYRETAYEVMRLFLTDFTDEELRACIDRAYDSKFDTPEIAPLVKKSDAWYLELFHGATIAFKDMALSILPHLMTTAARKQNCSDEIVILTATSGDTGKAALAGFADVPGTRIMVFYPKGGVSPIQELQMITQKGQNTRVAGILGNFDDAQTGVKKLFADEALRAKALEAGFRFSSANSINIGRLIPQVAYYVYACAGLVGRGELSEGETIDVAVPTGNFGNILAGYYAKLMGAPIEKLICASNDNRVLCDFFDSGCYDKNREFILTTSPSMDILVSSNLERLIYRICGEDAAKTAGFMKQLSETGRYQITPQMREALSDFIGGCALQDETADKIRREFLSDHYVLDPHTAVAAAVGEAYRKQTGDGRKLLVISTASPYKFVRSVVPAIDAACGQTDDFALADRLEELSGIPQPGAICQIRGARILHNLTIEQTEMKQAVCEFLGIE